MEVTATAPGKVFVLGEYAVALGAPAVVAAVDRRLGCRVRRTPGHGRLSIRVGDEVHRGSLADETLQGVPASTRFAAAAILVGARRLGVRDVDLEVETWSDLDGRGPKTGLGGSAAVVAAALGALDALTAGRKEDPQTLASLGVAAHRFAQGGGSGADVVAATLGGIHQVSGLDASEPPTSVTDCLAGARLRAEPLRLPADWLLDVVATGEAASTGPRIRRFVDRAHGRGPLGKGGATLLEVWSTGMADAVAQFGDGCRRRESGPVLNAMARARVLLGRLGPLAGIRIWTVGLRRACAALGRPDDGEVKPSGAGGGDCAVALVRASARDELRQAWRAAGLQPLEVGASLDGVKVQVVREGGEDG